ncbi:MAG TPA: hypothetical protein VMF31_08565 [Solirubrobacterales bacterium]|nr:hypothetical protein [Solirubrobacterales bacterium]
MLIRSIVAAVACLLLAGSAFGLAGCSDDGGSGEGRSAAAPPSEDPGLIHVHGLGVDPADGALFVASHTGLFRLPADEDGAERVADRYQDTMAFTIVGPNRFLGSGHPDAGEDLPPYLGLIESEDAGRSWEEVSLMGEVDFHLLAAAGDRIYGFGSAWGGTEPIFLASEDGGETWSDRKVPGPLQSLVVSPADPEKLVASSDRELLVSRDGGKRWESLRAAPGLLAWPDRGELFRADAEGRIEVSRDEGRGWRKTGNLGDAPSAFGHGDGRLFAATHQGSILESGDRGSSWDVRYRE